jgi:hypothetical protein
MGNRACVIVSLKLAEMHRLKKHWRINAFSGGEFLPKKIWK